MRGINQSFLKVMDLINGEIMSKKRFTSEDDIGKLREAEILLSQ